MQQGTNIHKESELVNIAFYIIHKLLLYSNNTQVLSQFTRQNVQANNMFYNIIPTHSPTRTPITAAGGLGCYCVPSLHIPM